MSGHSKWSTIKRKKEATDKARSLVFSKLSRVITLSVQEGGGITDPAANIKLRMAIEKARACNMPRVNIERAIEKAKGADQAKLSQVVYEGFGPGGVAFIISATTDNPNRTIAAVKNTFEKPGGRLGNENSVKYQFTKCGLAQCAPGSSEESVYAFAEKIGAIDMEEEDGVWYVYTPFEKIGYVMEYAGDLVLDGTDVFYKPHTYVGVSEADASRLESIVQALEELDEVDAVYTNHTSTT